MTDESYQITFGSKPPKKTKLSTDPQKPPKKNFTLSEKELAKYRTAAETLVIFTAMELSTVVSSDKKNPLKGDALRFLMDARNEGHAKSTAVKGGLDIWEWLGNCSLNKPKPI